MSKTVQDLKEAAAAGERLADAMERTRVPGGGAGGGPDLGPALARLTGQVEALRREGRNPMTALQTNLRKAGR